VYSPGRFVMLPYWAFMVAMKLAGKDWDFVYCYSQRHIIILAYVLRRLLFKRYKLVNDALLTWRLSPSSGFRKKFREAEERIAGKCSDIVIAVSELSRNFYGERAVLVPTLVDTDAFRMDKWLRLKARAKYGIAEGDKVVGVVGPFVDEYNKPSLEFLRKNIGRFGKRIRFMVIGKLEGVGRVWDERITYTGYVQDYAGYLSALDALLVVRTIPTDGAINRMVEAMAVGLPVFANHMVGGAMDYGKPNKDFFVFSDGELPSRINKLMFNGRLLSQVGRNARGIAVKHYGEVKYKQKLLEALAK
jgi:glycosyltransferase involved in cell wall biosynthesis